jgi:dolichol-phosphate mannosyltransferase
MKIALVIPVYNESESLPGLLGTLRAVCNRPGYAFDWIFINDGSTDGSAELLAAEAARDDRVRVISFTRNFGHQAAVTAGLDFAEADAVIVMDADLQDPPGLIWQMIDLWQAGFDIVSPQRISREGETRFKIWTAAFFYRLMQNAIDPRLKPQVSDFRLYSRVAVQGMRQFREQHRFLRGMAAWLGLKEAVIPFHRAARAAGQTKYSTFKMLKFAWTAVSSFSALPLRIATGFGFLAMLLGFCYSIYTIYVRFITGQVVPGWTSLACLQILFSGATLFCLGLIGDYIGRIYEETKQRPLYLVRDLKNLEMKPVLRAGIMLDSHQ